MAGQSSGLKTGHKRRRDATTVAKLLRDTTLKTASVLWDHIEIWLNPIAAAVGESKATINAILHPDGAAPSLCRLQIARTELRKPLSERMIAYILHQVLSGLHYLHSNKVAYGNVSVGRIFWAPNGTIKLGDLPSGVSGFSHITGCA